MSATAADRLGYSNAMPKPVIPADTAHHVRPSPSTIIATPAPQIQLLQELIQVATDAVL